MLVCAPQRSDQKGLWTVTGEAVDDHLRREERDTVDDQIQVRLHRKEWEGMPVINVCQICAFQDMEELQLDPLDILVGEITDRLEHVLPVLPGKAQDHMDDGLQVAGSELFQCILETG